MSEGKRLLIIDDDPDFVEGIKSILEGADYAVEVAYNPDDGLKALQAKLSGPCLLLSLIFSGE